MEAINRMKSNIDWVMGPIWRTIPIYSTIKDGDKQEKTIDYDDKTTQRWFDPQYFCAYLYSPLSSTYRQTSNMVTGLIDRSKEMDLVEKSDTVSSYVGITSSVGVLTGLTLGFSTLTAPIGIPILVVSSFAAMSVAYYGTGRSAYTLVNRYQQGESVSFMDTVARNCWLNASCALLSTATNVSTDWLANASSGGHVVSDWARWGITSLSVANLSTSIANFLNNAFNVTKKEEITTSDKLNLSTSMAFLMLSLAKFRTADGIIQGVQQEEIATYRSALNKKTQKVFDELLKAYKQIGKSEIHSQGKFIQDIKASINTVQDFWKQLKFTPDKMFRVNEEYTMHPRALAQFVKEQRDLFMDQVNKFHNKEISLKKFNESIKDMRRHYRLKTEHETLKSADYLLKKFDFDAMKAKIGNKNHRLQPYEVNRLAHLGKSLCKNDPELFNFGLEVAAKQNVKNAHELSSVIEFTGRNINKVVKMMRQSSPNLGESRKFYQQQAIQDAVKSDQLNENFTKLRKSFETLKSSFGFKNTISAVNHYDKHAGKFGENIEPKSYINIATNLIKKSPTETKWTQNGEAVSYLYKGKDAVCAVYKNVLDKTYYIASLYKRD